MSNRACQWEFGHNAGQPDHWARICHGVSAAHNAAPATFSLVTVIAATCCAVVILAVLTFAACMLAAPAPMLADDDEETVQ